ncbi:unnamed protein product [Cladocopium goreaui]|uniref:Transmembrane protein n=1 Tax=Cladocopium goreaui TaxID=2562237 RepID=A0A9P1CV23_9DINO|nr:unnamed protein product [Cladocopium goreaui]
MSLEVWSFRLSIRLNGQILRRPPGRRRFRLWRHALAGAKDCQQGRRTYDDDDDEDDYDDELRRDEPVDSGSVATIVSFALLAVTSLGQRPITWRAEQSEGDRISGLPGDIPQDLVNQQNAAFSGSNDSPQIKKVQAVFDTYYAEGETVQ